MDTEPQAYAQQLDFFKQTTYFACTTNRAAQSQLKQLQHRLQMSMQLSLQSHQQTLVHFKNSLSQLNPDNGLARGYALVQKADGMLVRSEAQLQIGDDINISLPAGKVKAAVTALQSKDANA